MIAMLMGDKQSWYLFRINSQQLYICLIKLCLSTCIKEKLLVLVFHKASEAPVGFQILISLIVVIDNAYANCIILGILAGNDWFQSGNC